MAKKLIAGNWKMNGLTDDARALIADIVNKLETEDEILGKADILVCPTTLHIPAVRHALYGYPKVAYGAQDCSAFENGAHTGDASAAQLKDAGCRYVILGHSERRQNHNETNEDVSAKAKQAFSNDLIPIICVGETIEDRDAGREQDVVAEQLKGSIPDVGQFDELIIAYEPVWAIGTGKTASPEDAQAMHAFIREKLKDHVDNAAKVRILYGGSMKPDNAAQLLACDDIDGGLIGGASLQADQFLAIARAA